VPCGDRHTLPTSGMIGVLRFQAKVGEGRNTTLSILLEVKWNVLSARVEVDNGSETLERQFLSINQIDFSENNRGQFDSLDRIIWQHPIEGWRIGIDTNRQIIKGERTLLVEMS
jgi:hypothetical protein